MSEPEASSTCPYVQVGRFFTSCSSNC